MTPRLTSAAWKKPMAWVLVMPSSSCWYICASSSRQRPSRGTLSAFMRTCRAATSAGVIFLRRPVADGVQAWTPDPVVSTRWPAAGSHLASMASAAWKMSSLRSWSITLFRLLYDSSTRSAYLMRIGLVVSSSRVYSTSWSTRWKTAAGREERFTSTPDGAPALGMCTFLPSLTYISSLTARERKLFSAKRPSTMVLSQISFCTAIFCKF